MLKKTREAIVKECLHLLERMRKGGMGKKASMDGRMIWQLEGYEDDESEYAYVDETVKNHLTQALNEYHQAIVEMVEGKERREPRMEKVQSIGYNSVDRENMAVNQTLNDIKEELQK